MDSVVTIEITQAKADVVPVLRDVGRRTPHVPVHANIVQGVRTTQPVLDDSGNLERVRLVRVEAATLSVDGVQSRGKE